MFCCNYGIFSEMACDQVEAVQNETTGTFMVKRGQKSSDIAHVELKATVNMTPINSCNEQLKYFLEKLHVAHTVKPVLSNYLLQMRFLKTSDWLMQGFIDVDSIQKSMVQSKSNLQ